MKVKFPEAVVELSKIDSNAFSILTATDKALRKAGATEEDRQEYEREATSDDYDHLVQTTMKYVTTK